MKARLIFQRRPPEVNQPSSPVYAVEPDMPIPDGWEEAEVITEPTFRGTTLVGVKGEFDLCNCGDDRRSHDKHVGRCMARKYAKACECLRFREKR